MGEKNRFGYLAYCDDCNWASRFQYPFDDQAWDDLNEHVQTEHAATYGVREESRE